MVAAAAFGRRQVQALPGHRACLCTESALLQRFTTKKAPLKEPFFVG